MPTTDDMLREIRATRAALDRRRDAELRALVAAAVSCDAVIMPTEFATRPTIMLPTTMYDRICALFPILKSEKPHG